MIVVVLSLDSVLSSTQIPQQLKREGNIEDLLKNFDHVALLTQDTKNFTDYLDGIEHVPCAPSKSERIHRVLSRLAYLRWAYFYIYSSLWILKHRGKIRLIVSIGVDSPAPLLSLLFGIRCVVYYHYDVAFQVSNINRRHVIGTLLLLLERFAFRRADTVWITSPSLMSKVKMSAAKRIRIIPNWVDIQKIGSAQSSEERRAGFRVLFVGRLHQVKQVDLLIQAFQLVHARIPSTSLYILGNGEQRQSLVKLTNNLGLSASVHFEGQVDQKTVFTMMKKSDVLVLPSKVEGNPRVLIEAMANRVPIVATNVPGIKEMIQHKKTGYLIDNQKPKDLAYSIEYVLRNKQDSTNMVKSAYAFAEQNFSKENVLKKIRGELELLLRARVSCNCIAFIVRKKTDLD